jgi:outer membrane lipoprotein SlyB
LIVSKIRFAALLLAVTLVFVAGCATQPTAPREATVIGISQVERANPDTQIVGAVGGGLIGGLIGHQIGAGTGQALATVAGALAGGYVGSEIARRNDRETVYQITYRYDDGGVDNMTLPRKPDLRIGQRVRVYTDQLVPL